MTTYETISLIISGVGTAFVGGTLLYAVKQIRLIVNSHADNHKWNRRIATQNAISAISNDITDSRLNQKFRHIHVKQPIPLVELLEAFEDEPELQRECHIVLNRYEGLARGIKAGIYSEAVVKMARRYAMEHTITAFKEYIEHERNAGARCAWIDSEDLIEKWNSEEISKSQLKKTGYIGISDHN